jgi:BASS family bile acid:Na+ symporter
MVILAGSSALVAPLLLRLLLPRVLQFLPPVPAESPPLVIDALKVASTLLVAQFLPLVVGLAVRHLRPAVAERLKKPANLLGVVLNLATLGLVIYVQFNMLIAIPLRGYAGMLALVLAGVAAGWVLGGGNRSAMVMATSVRNVGVSLVIVTAAFADTGAVAATVAFALFQTIVMALIAVCWGAAVLGQKRTLTCGNEPDRCVPSPSVHSKSACSGGAGAETRF